MAGRLPWAAAAVVPLLCLLLAHSCAAQMGGMPKKEKILHNKADLKYIGCAVCEEVAKTVHRTVSDMRKALPEGRKLKEIDIIEKLESVCHPEEEAGQWTSHFDLVSEDGLLKLKDMGARGKCKAECQTIARSCDNILGEHDTDVAEALYKRGWEAQPPERQQATKEKGGGQTKHPPRELSSEHSSHSFSATTSLTCAHPSLQSCQRLAGRTTRSGRS